jgi:hypothetical protein
MMQPLMRMQVFHRVFDGQDVPAAVLVAMIDHRRQRGGLARAGGADHQHDTALVHDDRLQHLRQPQFVAGEDAVVEVANHHAGVPR